MTNKEIDAARLLLLFNAIRLVILGEPPTGPKMQIAREEMMLCMMQARSISPEAMCVGNVIGYYSHGEKLDSSAKYDYPGIYQRVKDIILGNECFRNFLSALADGLNRDGDNVAKQRLLEDGVYIASSPDKSTIMRELGISSEGEYGSSQNVGCMVPIALAIAITIIGSICGCGPSEPSESEIANGMRRQFIMNTGAYPSSVKAKKIGSGRWAVRMTAERYGERRSLDATAIMDKNGDIHYYTN